MSMRHRYVFFILFIVFACPGLSQEKQQDYLQEIRLKLESCRGIQRINCLNELARRMMYVNYAKWDSSLYYSGLAMKEARQMNYTAGLCQANIVQGDALLQYQWAVEAEPCFRNAILLAREVDDEALLIRATRRLGQSYWYQGRFQEAIDKIRVTIPYFEKVKNDFQLINCYTSIALIYDDWGNFEQGFVYGQKALQLSREKKDVDNIVQCLSMIGILYANIGDTATALSYYRQAVSILPPCDNCYQQRALDVMRGNLFRRQGAYDSSLYYLEKAYKGNPTSTLTKLFMAETLIGQGRFDTALVILIGLDSFHRKNGSSARYWQTCAITGAAYFGKKEYDKALQFAGFAIQLSEEKKIRDQYLLDALQLVAAVYKQKKIPDSALFFMERYARLKDSVISDKLKGKLFEFRRIAEDEKKQSQIELLENQARQGLQIRNLLIGIIALIVATGFFILRSVSLRRRNERLKNEQLQSQLQHKATELEMQALRAQMNPHFIFNCLSSINRFILKNETAIASDYLTRFSRLIRLVLIHSRSSLILLKEEIEMLKLYLDMEQLRFKQAFGYTITIAENIDPETISIPPLLLQPFCENAIWHGLMHKEGGGQLLVSIGKEQNQLFCEITDNGIGRKKAMEIKNGAAEHQQSLGLKITAERLALLNQEKRFDTSCKIEDLVDKQGVPAGTKVILKMKYDQLDETTA